MRVASLALDPDAVTSASVGVEVCPSVNTHVYLVALVPYQPDALGILLVDVVDIAIWECVRYEEVFLVVSVMHTSRVWDLWKSARWNQTMSIP